MSVPDKDLDEDDATYCQEHDEPQPCWACRFDYLEQRAEELRERWRDGESND